MSGLEFIKSLEDVDKVIKIIELCFIIFFSYYSFKKILNIEKNIIKNKIFIVFSIPIIAIITRKVEYEIDYYYSWTLLILSMATINELIYKKDIIITLLITIISICINYVIYIISVTIAFIPNAILKIKNDYVGLIVIIIIYTIIVYKFLNVKKMKYGFSFIQNKIENSFLKILIMNISVIILLLFILIQDKLFWNMRIPALMICVLAFSMFLSIKQSFDIYYKQKILTKDLEQTKSELEAKKEEIDKLEKENLEFSKTSHSLAHKQKSLEYKLEKLMKTNVDSKDKESIQKEIQSISKEVYKEPQRLDLPKTEIEVIDDMFAYMQAECIKNKIKFELQVVGNIFYMINHLISENDLEILIADHIKDAIIAINHCDNSNRSILVRIGKINNVYSLYIYDSGKEFEKEVLENLGKKPITTHTDTGGTGMGFMNTFDTLNRTKASLIINEIGKPCIDNYTKVVIFKFDNNNEFKVESYRNEVIVI